jgi:hypothetical protein
MRDFGRGGMRARMRARDQRPAVARYDVIQNLLDSANMGLSLLVVAERHTVGRRNVRMLPLTAMRVMPLGQTAVTR